MRKLTSLAAFLVALFGFSISAQAVTLFLLEDNGTLWKTETDSLGSPTFIGTIPSPEYLDVVELVAVSSDQLYAFERAGSDTSRPARLLVIDTSNASVISTVEIPSFNRGVWGRGFDLSPDGVLYGVFPAGPNNAQELRTIDPTNGDTARVLGLGSVLNWEALAFGPDGTLYAATFPSGSFYAIDIDAGTATSIGRMGIEVDTLAYASDGYLYGAQSGGGRPTLYKWDPANPVLTEVGNSGVNSIVGIAEEITRQPVTQISIDIKPGGDPNCLNINDHGVIPVAILGNAFDVHTVDTTSLVFAGLTPRVKNNGQLSCSYEDVNIDGYPDLVCQFEDNSTNWAPDGDTATLTGETYDGIPIEGTDSICLVPANGPPVNGKQAPPLDPTPWW